MTTMLVTMFLSLLVSSVIATEKDSAPLRLEDSKAVEAFIDSAEVVVIGFLEGEESHGYKPFVTATERMTRVSFAICTVKEVWADYSISSDTIVLFRKADNGQENLPLADTKKIDVDGLINFITTNEVRYLTEYSQMTGVGLFNSEVRSHLLLFANKGSKTFKELKKTLRDLAPEFTGKILFVFINGAAKSNIKPLGYFGLTPKDLPRIGIYDNDADMRWLMPEGEITTESVREYCQSFLRGELKDVKQAGPEPKTEL